MRLHYTPQYICTSKTSHGVTLPFWQPQSQTFKDFKKSLRKAQSKGYCLQNNATGTYHYLTLEAYKSFWDNPVWAQKEKNDGFYETTWNSDTQRVRTTIKHPNVPKQRYHFFNWEQPQVKSYFESQFMFNLRLKCCVYV